MKKCNEIPKVIHYCWFGRNPLPAAAEKCIMSWREKCPEYTIVKWTEDNFDLSECPIYVQQAYRAKKWAFVTDYARLKIVYDNGGIYLDTDVELLKSLSPLLINSAFFGFEDEAYVATGLGFGAVKGAPILMDLMKDYEGINFVKDNGEYDLMSCPVRNLHVFQRYGLVQNNKLQALKGGIVILPTDFLCPLDTKTGLLHKTRNTISIHHYSATWCDEATLEGRKKWRRKNRWKYYRRFPIRLVKKILSESLYQKIRKKMIGEHN